ncbi:hypothetical protein N9D66_00230 [Candidatus Nanopelagicales bacterium]|nr:hypothetical protein [Candidatus Nanopelagicales bacterium]
MASQSDSERHSRGHRGKKSGKSANAPDSSPGTGQDRAAKFAENLGRVSAAAFAFRDSFKQARAPATVSEQMALEHQAAQSRYSRAKAAHARKVRRLHSRARGMLGLAVVSGSVAAADFMVAGPEVWFWIGAPTAVLAGWTSRSDAARAKSLEPPKKPQVLPPPPPPLPEGYVGHAESVRLTNTRLQLARILPTIEPLHADAAAELRAADCEAAPAMTGLVQRIAALTEVAQQMPGTTAADTAIQSSTELRGYLASGVDRYDDLLRAALELLSAPDPNSLIETRLHTSMQELTAYSEGLHSAARAVADPPG